MLLFYKWKIWLIEGLWVLVCNKHIVKSDFGSIPAGFCALDYIRKPPQKPHPKISRQNSRSPKIWFHNSWQFKTCFPSTIHHCQRTILKARLRLFVAVKWIQLGTCLALCVFSNMLLSVQRGRQITMNAQSETLKQSCTNVSSRWKATRNWAITLDWTWLICILLIIILCVIFCFPQLRLPKTVEGSYYQEGCASNDSD